MGDPAFEQARVTFEQVEAFDPEERSGEIEDGRWVPVTRNTWRHGTICGNAYAVLRQYARTHPGWSVSVGDPGTKLRRNPDVLRGPDVGIVRAERAPVGRGAEGWLQGAPDVAVEVMGDDQTVSDLAKKALDYLSAGAKMVWVLDPDPRRVVLFLPPNQVRVLAADEAIEGGDALPGFACRVSELFE